MRASNGDRKRGELSPPVFCRGCVNYRHVVDRLGLLPDMRTLDASYGSAFNAVCLAKMGLTVEAVDYSTHAVEEGRRYVEATGVADRVTVRQGDLTKLDAPDASYDAVLCLGVLMHIPNLRVALGELVRVLKPGGVLLLSGVNRASPQFRVQRLFYRLARRGRVEIEELPGHTNLWISKGDEKLLARKVSIPWLIGVVRARGLAFQWKKPLHLTEAYVRFPQGRGRRGIVALNRAWFRHYPASLAIGNYLAFRKQP